MVKRLRHHPFTVVTWVQVPLGSPKKAFIYKEKLHFFIRENKEKRWGKRVENENGKIGEMEKKGMEKCGWTAGEMFSII